MKIKCLNRADTLFLSQIILFLVWGFQTRYILIIIVTQRAEKLPEIEFEDMKRKIWVPNPGHTNMVQIRPSSRIFFADLAIEFSIIKSLTALLSYFFSSQRTLISIVFI